MKAPEGSFSYRNATVIEYEGRAVATLIGYEITDHPEPITTGMPGTWYVNVLATLPGYRNLGLGSDLLRLAEETGRNLGKLGMSVIVSDTNAGARRLYERFGYRETARRTMIKEDWINEGREWLLLTKKNLTYQCAGRCARGRSHRTHQQYQGAEGSRAQGQAASGQGPAPPDQWPGPAERIGSPRRMDPARGVTTA